MIPSMNDLDKFKSKLRLEVELQNIKNLYALDPKSMANKYGRLDIRDVLGIEKRLYHGICDYFQYEDITNTFNLIELKNLSDKFNEIYTKDKDLIDNLERKVAGTYSLVIHLLQRGYFQSQLKTKFKFNFLIEGSRKPTQILKQLRSDIINNVRNKFEFPTKVDYADKLLVNPDDVLNI